jgi:hypothetical protein
MTARFFSVMDEKVARNPVARAVAKSGLESAMRDFQLMLYLLEEGTEQTSILTTASQMLAVSLKVRELQGRPDGVSVMRGSQSAILDRSRHGFMWRAADVVAIDVGLIEAMKAVTGATARQVQDAWLCVRQLEQEAVA